MNKRILDLFCGAGGAAMGYNRAGFDVVGVDIKPQPRYPFEFHKCDALEYVAEHGAEYDVIHASPPCQRYSMITVVHGDLVVARHPDFVAETRMILESIGKPYVIENVVGSPLNGSLMLSGSMFDLGVRRHRIFAGSVPLFSPFTCRHDYWAVPVYGHSGAGANRNIERERGRTNSVRDWARAMGIDWMSGDEMAEAIPPAYTEFIGKALISVL